MSDPEKITLGEVHFVNPPTGAFTYRLPSKGIDYTEGIRVRVPFRNSIRTGFLTRIFDGSDSPQLRDVLEPVDRIPLVPRDVLELTSWIADYYLCEWGEALAAAVPKGLRPTGQTRYRLSEAGRSELLIGQESGPTADMWRALRKSPLTSRQIRRRFQDGMGLLSRFRRLEWVETTDIMPQRSLQTMTIEWRWTGEMDYDSALETLPIKAVRLRRAIEILIETDGTVTQDKLSRLESGLSPIMRNLLRKGWVSCKQVQVSRLSSIQAGLSETAATEPKLSPEQIEIVRDVRRSLEAGRYQSFLLHGVTSSGKTLVYLETIAAALELGKGVIVMVPEISLTPQLTGRIHRRFGGRVVVTHSRLSDAERRDVWRMIRSGAVRAVVGPRSVVLTPVCDLGLVIIDEEHDDSYKQSDPAPRYHGRDVALYRASRADATVLMGSATPDVCSYMNAHRKRYKLVELKDRHGEGSLPDVWVVQWGSDGSGGCISPKLKKGIQKRLESGERVILLVNRRGFSTVIRCPECGDVAKCPNCDITLRYHRTGQKLECHYCGFVQKVIDKCPKCGSSRLFYGGVGTQRVERELQLLFRDARVVRMDLDTTRRHGAHQEILERFAKGEFDIMIGTQMVAKGHDFPDVTLVGILSADLEWLISDFRAVEKAFRLLTQASGRTGRAGKGEVVIQSWEPAHPLLRWVQEHNYHKLFEAEIEARKELNYPPFGDLISILIRGPNRETVIDAASWLRTDLEGKVSDCVILGPAPPPVERIENLFRRRLLLKLPRRDTRVAGHIKRILKDKVAELRSCYRRDNIRIIVDVDPVEV